MQKLRRLHDNVRQNTQILNSGRNQYCNVSQTYLLVTACSMYVFCTNVRCRNYREA